MAFDPDAWLSSNAVPSSTVPAAGFDPNLFLKSAPAEATPPTGGGFDPDAWLQSKVPPAAPTPTPAPAPTPETPPPAAPYQTQTGPEGFQLGRGFVAGALGSNPKMFGGALEAAGTLVDSPTVI